MDTQVLVIGGGFAGVATAQGLESKGVKTTLVDKKDYFEVTYAVLRDITAPEKNNNKARKRYSDFLNGNFIQSGVKELRANSALLENGDEMQFDYAVIASGSRYPTMPVFKSHTAIDIHSRNSELSTYHKQLKSASEVLIIGGGVVGVELAGEIADAMPHLDVTLAHKSNALLDGFNSKAQSRVLNQLNSLGVGVEFNTDYRVENNQYVDSISGKTSDADLVFTAVGTKPNNEFLLQNFADILNEKGLVKVDKNLAVINQPNLYALGDIADVGEAKLGYLALQQGTYLAKTIAKKLAGKTAKGYKRNPFIALVPTGQKTGVVQLPFAVTSWKPLVNMKQKDLFISKTFKAFGA